mmetsp:Transcript_42737/g.112475  ORF Transcript_42737/g.112475 Transcript_42737/m.112475 type:complete len:224 (+) Transcript_42737:506-1177(+)
MPCTMQSSGVIVATMASETAPNECTWKVPSCVVRKVTRSPMSDLSGPGSEEAAPLNAMHALSRAPARNGISANGVGGEASRKIRSMKACDSCAALKRASVSVDSLSSKAQTRLRRKSSRTHTIDILYMSGAYLGMSGSMYRKPLTNAPALNAFAAWRAFGLVGGPHDPEPGNPPVSPGKREYACVPDEPLPEASRISGLRFCLIFSSSVFIKAELGSSSRPFS